MEELVTKDSTQSSACWAAMEEMARRHIEQWLQGLLEDEVTEFLGRTRYRRRGEGERGYLRSGYRESTESWKGLLRDARQRGLRCPRVVIGDGHLGIWAALREVYPDSDEQRCWNHRIVNVLDQVPKRSHEEAKGKLRKIAYAETLKEAERRRRTFQSWARGEGLQRAAELIEEDWERMVSYYRYRRAHWRHLRTTKRDRVAVCGVEVTDGRSQAIQEDRQRHRRDLEDAAGG